MGDFQIRKPLSAATVAEVLAIPEIWEKKFFQYWIFQLFKWRMVSVLILSMRQTKMRFLLSRNPFCWITTLGKLSIKRAN